MNKGIVIGAIVLVMIIVIIGVANSLNLESYDEPLIDDSKVGESSTDEGVILVPENTGRNLSVELAEKVGISSSP